MALADLYPGRSSVQQTKDLLDDCLARRDELGVEQVLALAADTPKIQLLQELGFRHLASLPAHYMIRNERFDCQLLSLPSS